MQMQHSVAIGEYVPLLDIVIRCSVMAAALQTNLPHVDGGQYDSHQVLQEQTISLAPPAYALSCVISFTLLAYGRELHALLQSSCSARQTAHLL